MDRLRNTTLFLASFAACLALGVGRANAAPIMSGYEYSTEANNSGGQLTVGERFHTNAPISISQLGLGAFTGPVTYSHPVGLWDTSGNLLASTTVNVGDPLVGHFQYHALAQPVILPAGVDFIVGAQIANVANPGGPADPYANQLFNFTTDPRVTFEDTRVHDGLLLMFPERVTASGSVPADPAFGTAAYEFGTFSANFLVGDAPAGSAVPEPASLMVLSVALAGLAGATWLKRRPVVKGPC